MNWIDEMGTSQNNCAVFYKVDEQYGPLSNMARGFPVRIGDHVVRSSEALYQASRFPAHPEIQKEIISQASAMAAKMKAKKDRRRDLSSRSDWEEVRVDVMRWCIRVKLIQNFGEFLSALMSTSERPIVEKSRKDRFWGAVLEADGALHGKNQLGLLLTELRSEVRAWLAAGEDDDAHYPAVQPLSIPNFSLLGEQIGAIECPD